MSDKIFDDFFDEFDDMIERMGQVGEDVAAGTATVQVDVRDDGDEYTVLADLPGYDADDVDLKLTGQRLEITAEREDERREAESDDESTYVRRERRRQSVSRTVGLPEEVDAEEVEANLNGGVLTVTLPKTHGEEGRQIEIEG